MGVIITLDRIEKTSEKLITEKIKSARENIVLIINSGGGSIESAFRIFEVIRNSRYPVMGIVNGKAASSAIYILEACVQRIAFLHSKIEFHTVTVKKDFHLIDKNLLERAEKSENRMAKFISARSGIKLEEVIKMMREKRIVSPEEALELKLIDKIEKNTFYDYKAA